MSDRTVVATGVGAISPLARDSSTHFARLLGGESGVTRLDADAYRNYPPILQARVRDFDRRRFVPDRMLRKLLSPSPAYALAGATEALRDAGLEGAQLVDAGLYVGSVCLDANPEAFIPALRVSVNEINDLDLARFATHGMTLIDPLFLVKSLPNAGLCGIAIQHQLLGPNANITNGGVSGLQAIIAAVDAIKRGDADMALAGAYDSLLQMDCIVDHLLAGRLARASGAPAHACRAFDSQRNGYALGEGAAFVMLETAEHARRRGARVYGAIVGGAQAASPCNMIDPQASDGGALARSARRATDQSGTAPEEIEAVFGDGLAIERDDDLEGAAYAEVLGRSGAPFTSATGAIGYTGAAGGLFSLVHALLAIRHGTIPPLINCADPVPGCPLPIAHQPRPASIRRALVWTSDRGVKSAAIVVDAWQNHAGR